MRFNSPDSPRKPKQPKVRKGRNPPQDCDAFIPQEEEAKSTDVSRAEIHVHRKVQLVKEEKPKTAEEPNKKEEEVKEVKAEEPMKVGPKCQFQTPFKLYSKTVNALPALLTTFGAKFGQVVLPEDGFYSLNLQSNINCSFSSGAEESVQSALKFGFAFEFQGEYRSCSKEDTFSVNGVWQQAKQHLFTQVHPPKFTSPQAITLNVLFYKNELFITQENNLVIKLTVDAEGMNKGKQVRLCLQGMNCSATIQRSEVTSADIERLKTVKHGDKSCSICLEALDKERELKCGHRYCQQCIH